MQPPKTHFLTFSSETKIMKITHSAERPTVSSNFNATAYFLIPEHNEQQTQLCPPNRTCCKNVTESSSFKPAAKKSQKFGAVGFHLKQIPIQVYKELDNTEAEMLKKQGIHVHSQCQPMLPRPRLGRLASQHQCIFSRQPFQAGQHKLWMP